MSDISLWIRDLCTVGTWTSKEMLAGLQIVQFRFSALNILAKYLSAESDGSGMHINNVIMLNRGHANTFANYCRCSLYAVMCSLMVIAIGESVVSTFLLPR